MAVLLAAALRGVERLVHRAHDIRDRDGIRRLREVVAPARPARARHERGAPQLAEELLEIGKRNVLPLADGRERHRAAVLTQRQVHHRGHRKPSLRSESHISLNT
jgi:hypothetical protein